MSPKKTIAVIFTIVLVAVGASLIGSGKFSQGRMFDFDPRGREDSEENDRGDRDDSNSRESSREEWGRGGGGDEEGPVPPDPIPVSTEVYPKPEDLFIKSVTAVPNPNKKDYYRITIKFGHNLTKVVTFDWKVFINGTPKTTLAENTIPSTYAIYEFDIHKDKLCPGKQWVYPYVYAEVDTKNMIAETNEWNNARGIQYGGNACNKELTRGMMTKILVEKVGLDPDKYILPNNGPTFGDVPKTHPQYKYIQAAYKAGWIKGNSDGNFSPDWTLSRAEAAKLINTALNLEESNSKIQYFSDNVIQIDGNILVETWYYKYVQNLAYWIIKSGKTIQVLEYQPGLFSPGSAASEAWFQDMIDWF